MKALIQFLRQKHVTYALTLIAASARVAMAFDLCSDTAAKLMALAKLLLVLLN